MAQGIILNKKAQFPNFGVAARVTNAAGYARDAVLNSVSQAQAAISGQFYYDTMKGGMQSFMGRALIDEKLGSDIFRKLRGSARALKRINLEKVARRAGRFGSDTAKFQNIIDRTTMDLAKNLQIFNESFSALADLIKEGDQQLSKMWQYEMKTMQKDIQAIIKADADKRIYLPESLLKQLKKEMKKVTKKEIAKLKKAKRKEEKVARFNQEGKIRKRGWISIGLGLLGISAFSGRVSFRAKRMIERFQRTAFEKVVAARTTIDKQIASGQFQPDFLVSVNEYTKNIASYNKAAEQFRDDLITLASVADNYLNEFIVELDKLTAWLKNYKAVQQNLRPQIQAININRKKMADLDQNQLYETAELAKQMEKLSNNIEKIFNTITRSMERLRKQQTKKGSDAYTNVRERFNVSQ